MVIGLLLKIYFVIVFSGIVSYQHRLLLKVVLEIFYLCFVCEEKVVVFVVVVFVFVVVFAIVVNIKALLMLNLNLVNKSFC